LAPLLGLDAGRPHDFLMQLELFLFKMRTPGQAAGFKAMLFFDATDAVRAPTIGVPRRWLARPSLCE
jgi:hypothetical protein